MERRIRAVLFDVIETLFPLEPVRRKLVQSGLPESSLDTWFARMLRDAFALDAAGTYRGFREVAAGALEVTFAAHGAAASQSQVDGVLGAFATLDRTPTPPRPSSASTRPASRSRRSRTGAPRPRGSSSSARRSSAWSAT
jgi:hypothetical protein